MTYNNESAKCASLHMNAAYHTHTPNLLDKDKMLSQCCTCKCIQILKDFLASHTSKTNQRILESGDITEVSKFDMIIERMRRSPTKCYNIC